MLRVFANVLDNAIKHTPAGGRVRVTAKRSGEAVAISFTDTGVGIPPEDLPRIWSAYSAATAAAPSANRPNGHDAVCELLTDLGDLILTGEFKLGVSPQVGFVCCNTNSPNLHLGRVVLTPTAIWIQKMSGIAEETRRKELKKIEVKVDPDTWHRITVEVCGDAGWPAPTSACWKDGMSGSRTARAAWAWWRAAKGHSSAISGARNRNRDPT